MKRTANFILSATIAIISLSILSCATTNEASKEDKKDEENMLIVKKGWFRMGLDTGELNEMPEHDVFVSTFKIDSYEVSAKEFAEFLNEKDNPEDKYFSFDRYSTITAVEEDGKKKYLPLQGYENYPANNVSWYGAYEYCKWKGKRMPTEAEWEKTARGNDRRLFPWGNDKPDGSKARYDQSWYENSINVMVNVDSFPDSASPYGTRNMAGNVWEWVSDWYKQNYYDFCDPYGMDYTNIASRIVDIREKKFIKAVEGNPSGPSARNPEGPSVGSFKVLRGGSWYDSYGDLVIRSTYRFWLDPLDRYLNTGFRCAK
jgi:formylglycine-generating enzyme required for sulfatase activity